MPGINLTVVAPGDVVGLMRSLVDLTKAVVDGQPPEVKKQLWDWYVNDVRQLRKLFGLEV